MEQGKRDEKIKVTAFLKSKELGKILGLDGTMDILNLLDHGPCQHKFIDEEQFIPTSTLTRRLKELQAIDIIKKNPITSNRRDTHQYDLTKSGMELMKFIHIYEKIMKIPNEQQTLIKINHK
jgi:DNA-binding HxlR family transcriptional regulator